MSSASIRDALKKAREPAANAVADLRDYGAEAGEDLVHRGRQVGRRLQRRLHDTLDQVGSAGRQARDRAGAAYDDAHDWAVENAQYAYRYAKDRPLMSLGIAVGLGLIVGGLLMSSRRNRY